MNCPKCDTEMTKHILGENEVGVVVVYDCPKCGHIEPVMEPKEATK